MTTLFDRYIDQVLRYANKSPDEAEVIQLELKDHLLQKTEDLVKQGFPREEAMLEALRQNGSPSVIGYQLRGRFPWIDIRSQGTARGVIAIGPRAIGIFAYGGVAIGVFAFGGVSIGIFSAGGLSLGLLFAWGGMGLGGLVAAGLAVGLVAAGGLAIGAVTAGNPGIGFWSPYGWHQGQTISYFNAHNVPPVLTSLEPLLHGLVQIDKYFLIIFPVCLVIMLGLHFLQYRELRYVQTGDNWLIKR